MEKNNNSGFEGGIVRDPMFVVCCVINNKLFELWSDLTIKQGLAGGIGGEEPAAAAAASRLFLYWNWKNSRCLN